MNWSRFSLLVIGLAFLNGCGSYPLKHRGQGLSEKAVAEFQLNVETAKTCARDAIKLSGNKAVGEIVLLWVVNDKGQIQDVKSENTTGNDGIGRCWLDYLKSVKFTPTPYNNKAEVEFEYTYK